MTNPSIFELAIRRQALVAMFIAFALATRRVVF
jgi:hypothetical protein